MIEESIQLPVKALEGSRTFRLTPRDIAMLQSIEVARFITLQGLEWLHYPGWRSRYTKHIQAGYSATSYEIDGNLKRRIKNLCDEGFITRLRAPFGIETTSSPTRGGLPPYIHALTPSGARLIATHTGIAIDDLYVDTQKRVRERLTHALLIGQLYAALRAKLESMPGICLTHWQGDHLTARNYDRLQVPKRQANERTEVLELPVQPDATFTIEHGQGTTTCFVEIDRDRTPESWATKIAAYHGYANSQPLAQRYGVDNFTVLALTSTPRQLQRMADATAEEIRMAHNRYLFALHAHIHPLTIGRHWWRISEVVQATQPVGSRRRSSTQYTARLAEHTFIA